MFFQQTKIEGTRHWAITVAVISMLLVQGCEKSSEQVNRPNGPDINAVNPNGLSAQPGVADPKVAEVTVPEVTVPEVTVPEQKAPVPPIDPNQPVDLGPAVLETQQVFQDYGLPVDWYANFQRPNAEPNGLDPILVTGVWTMVGPDVARKFQQRFHTSRTPAGTLNFGNVTAENPVFEEVMLLALIGPDHEHRKTFTVQAPQFADLPNVDARFLKSGGAIDFAEIRTAFTKQFTQFSTPRTVDEKLTIANDSDEYCHVFGTWQAPTGDAMAWARNQLAWRPVIRVEFVDGRRRLPGCYVSGSRRLAVGSYAQIGYRRINSEDYKQIHFAGPFLETAYQPVGESNVMLAAWELRTRSDECPKTFLYGQLESLNRELSPADQEAADILAAEIPISDKPSLVSVRTWPEITAFHRELHEILAPGQQAIPAIPVD